MMLMRLLNGFMLDQLQRGGYWMRLGVLEQYEPRPLSTGQQFPEPVPDADLPTISVITPTLDQGDFLEDTITSVLSQDYPKLEYIVQDGGSTDNSLEIIERHADRLTSWASEPDHGQADAVNRGFAKSSGEILAWLNSDDLFAPGALRCIGSFFARNPHVDVVYGHRIVIDASNREIGRWVLPPHCDKVLHWADYVPQETLFWRRSALGDESPVNPDLGFALDWDLLLRLIDRGARFKRLPYFLGIFRIHDRQKTSELIHCVGAREMDMIRKVRHGHVPDPRTIADHTMGYRWRAMLTSRLLEWNIRI
jgi:glycosyltransferase involved in cell wall biosynthesis